MGFYLAVNLIMIYGVIDMYRRVNQVVIYYDDATSTAEDKANWFLKNLHKSELVQIQHFTEFTHEPHGVPKMSIMIVYRKAIQDEV